MKQFEAANRRAAALRASQPVAVSVRYNRQLERLVIVLSSGVELLVAPQTTPGLKHARPADLSGAEISPSGLGVHFPRIDADIYVPALVERSNTG